MAKDPAFLFYPGDWLGGTMGMTIEQKGAYMELLVFQFNNGPFSQSQAKQVLSICFASVWQVVSKKFVMDPVTSLYSNKRLNDEIEKRRKFSESRRNNAKSVSSKSLAYAKHMENENRNENEDQKKTKEFFLDPFDDLWVERNLTMKASLYPGVDLQLELQRFRAKIAAAPQDYSGHDTNGLRKALLYHISHAPKSADTKQPRKKAFEL